MMENRGDWRTCTNRVLLAASMVAAACFCQAQQRSEYKGEEHWREVCERAKAQPLVPQAPSGPLTADQLSHCDETALYFGLGQKPDYAAALQCGWYQRAHPQNTAGNMFYGPGVLTMLYANGRGVSRDYGRAIRFACENAWAAEAETSGRIGHLEHLQATGSPNATFDLCDDITSGLSDGFCTSIQTRAQDAVRARQISALVEKLPPAANMAFQALQDAETEFEKARVSQEVDLSGTSRAAFELREQAKLRDQFLINLRRFGAGDIPAASAANLASLDQELNQVYERIRHSPASQWEYGTIKPEGIRETERRWVSLAEAWAAFARTAYPRLSATRLRAQLIRLRLHQLRSLAGN